MSAPIVIGTKPPTSVEEVVRWDAFLDLFDQCWDEEAGEPKNAFIYTLTIEDYAVLRIGLLKFSSTRWQNRESGREMKDRVTAILDAYWESHPKDRP